MHVAQLRRMSQIMFMVTAAFLAAPTFAQPPTYSVKVLTDPEGISTTSPFAVNDDGVVVGSIFNNFTGYFDGAIWDQNGHGTILSDAYGLDSAEGIGIENDGTILGGAVIDANAEVPHGVILKPDGTFQLLPSLAGSAGVYSAAFDANDAGVIVGVSATFATPFYWSAPQDAVIWIDGEIHSIGTIGGGGDVASAREINNNNVIIGLSNTPTSPLLRGFVWDEESGMQELQGLSNLFGFAAGINDDDLIVGFSHVQSGPDAPKIACIWHDYTQPPAELVLLDGDMNSVANGINNDGIIVGGAATPAGPRARLWMDGEVYDINDLLDEPFVAPIRSALRITDGGVILARAFDPNDPFGTLDVVLTPISCQGDFDGSGAVGIEDLLALLGAWGSCASCPHDLDGDGNVGVSDLLSLLASWGPCP